MVRLSVLTSLFKEEVRDTRVNSFVTMRNALRKVPWNLRNPDKYYAEGRTLLADSELFPTNSAQ